MRRAVFVTLLFACGSSSAPPAQPTGPTGPTDDERAAEAARLAEKARRDKLSAAQDERLDAAATALGATCDKPVDAAEQRCTPSCYAREAADPRAKQKVRGSAKIDHLVCTRDVEAGPFTLVDELGGRTLAVRSVRERFPKPSKKGSWRAKVEAEVSAALRPELVRGDIVVASGNWKSMTHPISKETLQCVTVSHYARAVPKPPDACGSQGKTTCEAANNTAALAINLVHFRLAEAQRLHGEGKSEPCQQAALDAIAIARGMPRWRQYAMLNVDKWKPYPRYRTRFDGILDEDTLFTRTLALGSAAEALYAECGGPPKPKTTPAQEHAFHSCAKE